MGIGLGVLRISGNPDSSTQRYSAQAHSLNVQFHVLNKKGTKEGYVTHCYFKICYNIKNWKLYSQHCWHFSGKRSITATSDQDNTNQNRLWLHHFFFTKVIQLSHTIVTIFWSFWYTVSCRTTSIHPFIWNVVFWLAFCESDGLMNSKEHIWNHREGVIYWLQYCWTCTAVW